MDEEHGTFWVGVIFEDENVLETSKDLSVIGMFSDEPEVQYRSKQTTGHK